MRRFKITGCKGQSALESAIACMFLFAFMLGMADVTRICYSWTSLQYAVNQSGRFGILGQVDEGQPDRESSIRTRVVTMANNLGVPIGLGDVSFIDSDGGNTAGAPLTFFTVRAETDIGVTPVTGLFLHILGAHYGDQSMHITVEAVMRNEPFRT